LSILVGNATNAPTSVLVKIAKIPKNLLKRNLRYNYYKERDEAAIGTSQSRKKKKIRRKMFVRVHPLREGDPLLEGKERPTSPRVDAGHMNGKKRKSILIILNLITRKILGVLS
jgi:hypothetical protein